MSGSGENLKFNFKIWIEDNDSTGILGMNQVKLLKEIDRLGTLNSAIEAMGYHYRKAWDKLKKIEKLLGFKIIYTHRGGKDHGNTVLTEKGKQLVIFIEELNDSCKKIFMEKCSKATDELKNKIKQINNL